MTSLFHRALSPRHVKLLQLGDGLIDEVISEHPLNIQVYS